MKVAVLAGALLAAGIGRAPGASVSLPEIPGTLFAVGWANNSPVYTADLRTGEFTLLGLSNAPFLNALAVTADGRILGAGNHSHLVEIDSQTGRATNLFRIDLPVEPFPLSIRGLAVSPGGDLYMFHSPNRNGDRFERTLWRMNILGEDVELITHYDGSTTVQGLAFAPDGTLWGLELQSDMNLITIDPETGTIFDQDEPDGLTGQSLEFIATDRLIVGDQFDNLRVFDFQGNVLTLGSGGTNVELRGLAFLPIPEPNLSVLAGACVVCILLRRV